MNLSKVFFIGLFCISLVACEKTNDDRGGLDVTQEFLSQYNGTYGEQHGRSDAGEKISLQRNGNIIITRLRKVGQVDNPVIPEDTVCSYTITGQIHYVVELYAIDRERTNEKDEVYHIPQTHNMVWSMEDAELTNSLESTSTSNTGCQTFLENLKTRMPSFTYGLELFGNGTIRLHTAGNNTYTGGQKPEAVLDEVFMRE